MPGCRPGWRKNNARPSTVLSKRHRFTRTLRHFEGRGGSKDFNEVLMKEKGLIQEQNRGPKKGGNLKTKVSNCMFPLFFS